MSRPRVSLWRMMAVVAIVAADCGLVRLFLRVSAGLGGLLAIGLVLSTGLIGFLLAQDRLRSFFAVSTAAASVASAVFYSFLMWYPAAAQAFYNAYLGTLLHFLPASMTSPLLVESPGAKGGVELFPKRSLLLAIEAFMSLPVLVIAIGAGLPCLRRGTGVARDRTQQPSEMP